MSARFEIFETEIANLHALRRQPVADGRGFLERLYCAEELALILGDRRIVQINRTLTHRKGVVRGLHFQRPPHAETKLVTCLRGAVLDVAVDLRRGSETFGAWYGRMLDETNAEMLVIPEGFGHGFQTLAEDTELVYLHTAAYAPDAEGGLDACDPALGIAWPLPIVERSERDAGLPGIAGFEGIEAFEGTAP